jgi:hypothetical protein
MFYLSSFFSNRAVPCSTSLSIVVYETNVAMDDIGRSRENGRQRQDPYKPVHAQVNLYVEN